MTRISLILCVLLTTTVACAQQPAPAPQQAQAAPQGQQAVHRHAILILPFRMLTEDAKYAWIGDAIQEDLQAELARNSLLQIVNPAPAPTEVAPATQPIGLDDQGALQLARDSRATVLVLGSYQVADQEIRITGKILDVPSGQIIGALKASGTERQILDLEDAIADQAKQLLGITPVTALQPLNDQPAPRPPVAQGAPAEPPATAQNVPYDTDYPEPAAEESVTVYEPQPRYYGTTYYYPSYRTVYVYPYSGYYYPYYSYYPYYYSYYDDYYFLPPSYYYRPYFYARFSYYHGYPYYWGYYGYYNHHHHDYYDRHYAYDRFYDRRGGADFDDRGPRFRGSTYTRDSLVVREPSRPDRASSFRSSSMLQRPRSDSLSAIRSSEPRRGDATFRSSEPTRPDRDGTRTTTIRPRDLDSTRADRTAATPGRPGSTEPRRSEVNRDPGRSTSPRTFERGDNTPSRSTPRSGAEARPTAPDRPSSVDRPRSDSGASRSRDAAPSREVAPRPSSPTPSRSAPSRSDSGIRSSRGADPGVRSAPSAPRSSVAPSRGSVAPSRSSVAPSRGSVAPSRGSVAPSRSAAPSRSGGAAPSRGGGGGGSGGARGGGGGGGGGRR